MTLAFDDIAVAEQACIESHLPPDPKAAALFVALKNWHLAALHRDHPRLLPDLQCTFRKLLVEIGLSGHLAEH